MPLPDIDFKEITKQMIIAAQGAISEDITDIKDLAEGEFKDFAMRTVELAVKVADGTISVEQAKFILDIRQTAMKGVLLSIQGIGMIAVQGAINAILDVLKETLNEAIPVIDIL